MHHPLVPDQQAPLTHGDAVGELVDRLVKLDGLLHPAAPDAG